jgi:hypothetical protein
MRNQVWDAALAELDALDLAELVLGLLSGDAVDGEATLGVVDEAEVLASLLDRDNVHEAGGVGGVGADLAIDLDGGVGVTDTIHQNSVLVLVYFFSVSPKLDPTADRCRLTCVHHA